MQIPNVFSLCTLLYSSFTWCHHISAWAWILHIYHRKPLCWNINEEMFNMPLWSNDKSCPCDYNKEKNNLINLFPCSPILLLSVWCIQRDPTYWVGGFRNVPSLLSSSQSLLSNSALYCLSSLFLDPQCVVNRSQSWVGVSTSCHLAGTPLICPLWQPCLSLLVLSKIFTVTEFCHTKKRLYNCTEKVYQGPLSYCIANNIVFFVLFIWPSNPSPLSDNVDIILLCKTQWHDLNYLFLQCFNYILV